VGRRELTTKYHQEWDALPTERKLKVIKEAIAIEEEYQVNLSVWCIFLLCCYCTVQKIGMKIF